MITIDDLYAPTELCNDGCAEEVDFGLDILQEGEPSVIVCTGEDCSHVVDAASALHSSGAECIFRVADASVLSSSGATTDLIPFASFKEDHVAGDSNEQFWPDCAIVESTQVQTVCSPLEIKGSESSSGDDDDDFRSRGEWESDEATKRRLKKHQQCSSSVEEGAAVSVLQFRDRLAEEEKVDLLKQHTDSLANRRLPPAVGVPEPPSSGTVDVYDPEKSRALLRNDTFETCNRALLDLLAKYS
ncbi:hypothetical protein DIPPA_55311 [Diplonema papillatum]|nr:hypothetical protein DIPPA_55311 [Diplonema papillatum]